MFSHFLDEYQRGRTPNPDVLCNKEIKFKAFLHHALALGAEAIATGHYAKVKTVDGRPALFKAKDRNKDQSYFLHAMDPSALAKTLFPLGDLLKPEVRAIAKALGLVTQDKKDSTGLCFIGERRFKPFLNEYLLAQPGPIVSSLGEILGQHDGLMFYTLGQRQGLGIGGTKSGLEEPWYVVDKDLTNNRLIVAQGADHPMLLAQGLICGPIHWLSPQAPERFPLSCSAKIRYRQNEQSCMISPPDGDQHCVLFCDPQRAITPGQYVVFYDHNHCLGGACIEAVIR